MFLDIKRKRHLFWQGKVFQTRGPVAVKALLPTVESLLDGMSRWQLQLLRGSRVIFDPGL